MALRELGGNFDYGDVFTRPAEQATRRQNCGYAGFSNLDQERALRIENDLSNWAALMQITARISIEHGRYWPMTSDSALRRYFRTWV